MTSWDLLIRPSFFQLIPLAPLATRANPTVAPTILCVPDTGRRRNVAINSHTQEPAKRTILQLYMISLQWSFNSLNMIKAIPSSLSLHARLPLIQGQKGCRICPQIFFDCADRDSSVSSARETSAKQAALSTQHICKRQWNSISFSDLKKMFSLQCYDAKWPFLAQTAPCLFPSLVSLSLPFWNPGRHGRSTTVNASVQLVPYWRLFSVCGY
jgi:hypothetical protein